MFIAQGTLGLFIMSAAVGDGLQNDFSRVSITDTVSSERKFTKVPAYAYVCSLSVSNGFY